MQFLARYNLTYSERDVANPLIRNEMFQKFGVLVIPVVVIGKQAFFGYDANRDAIATALGLPPD